MMRRLLFVFACLLLSRSVSYSQALCGFDAVHAQKLATDPAYAARVQQNISSWIGAQTLGSLSQILQTPAGPVYEIPVVIHVIRPNAATTIDPNTNPSDAQLTGMIDYLNQTYAAQYTYPDTNNGGTAFPVRFVLAKRAPNCSPTTGILRIDGSGLPDYVADGITTNQTLNPGEDDGVVKALSTWPVSRYYNIYIVNKINGQTITPGTPYTAGYAFFPNGNYTDATVMLAAAAKAGEITLPHEIGHAFSLFHTFQGDNGGANCPVDTNCLINGDLVCDTDPHKRSNFNCPAGLTNPCTGTLYGNVVRNFMDYSGCQDRFTPGQRQRFLFSVLNDRPGLANSLGGVAPPAVATTAATCNPTMISPAGTLDAGPKKVSFAGIVSQSQGGYITDGNVVYSDLTCAYTGNLRVGTSYPINIVTTSPNSKVRVWIDLNNDGIFTSPGELIYNAGNNASSPNFNGNWTVPSTITTCTNLRMRVIVERSLSATIGSCAILQNGQAEDYTVIARPALDTPVIAFAANSTNPSCTGTPLTFNATVGATATNPSYRWYINNVLQAGASSTFTTSTPANGDKIRCWVKYTGSCGIDSIFSNTLTVIRGTSVVASVGLTLTAGSNPGCSGQSLTFTATPVNGGTAPTFIFKVNGTIVQSGLSNTFTTTTLTNNSSVMVQMNSNSSCALPAMVFSSAIPYTYGIVNAVVAIAQTAGTNPGCSGKPVTFTATGTNGGPAPIYTWQVNGISVPTSSSNTFTYLPANGDVVRAILTSNNPCVTTPKDTSAAITLTVNPSVTPAVSIALTKGSNPGCRDSVLEFTAITTDLTNTPDLKWYVNGVMTATTNPFTTSTLSNGDVVYAVASSTGTGCRTVDSATSGLITLRIDTPATPVTISYIGGNLIASSATIQWYGPNGSIPGATGATYHPKEEGYYYAVATNGVCPSAPSNILLISTLTVGNLDLSAFNLAPNPTTGNVTLSWSNHTAGLVSVEVYNSLGMRVHSERIEGGVQSKTVSMEALANGTYFFVLRNTTGAAGTMPVVLRR